MKRLRPQQILRHSRELRHKATDAETALWRHLRNRELGGAKFSRQHPVGRFILDFYCHEARLAVELDGGGHAEKDQADYDWERTLELQSKGIRVIRFWDNEVLQNMESVLEAILDALTPTLSQRERGPSGAPF